jgi:hypothetical protein
MDSHRAVTDSNDSKRRLLRFTSPRRAWALTLAAATGGTACLVVAIFAHGDARIAWIAVSAVLLITAAYCAVGTSLETHGTRPLDPDEPPPVTPLPQSPVTLIHNPDVPPNNRWRGP